MNYFNQVRSEARAAYRRIKSVDCTALDTHILFRPNGFSHLVQRGNHRSRGDQLRRFRCLPFVVPVLTSRSVRIEYHEQRYGETLTRYWTFISMRPDLPIKVVVRQINLDDKEFRSVFPILQESPR